MTTAESIEFNILISKFLGKDDEHLYIHYDMVTYRGIELRYHDGSLDWLRPVFLCLNEMGYKITVAWHPVDTVGDRDLSCSIQKAGSGIIVNGPGCVIAALQKLIKTFNI